LRAYLDASILVALFTEDAHTARAESFLRESGCTPIVSDFARAEFSSAISRRVRQDLIAAEDARRACAHLDAWIARAAEPAETETADIATATAFLRRLDVGLRTPDALNIAIAFRLGVEIATFDATMAASAMALSIKVLPA
jgi:uncharacterized protein